MAVLHIVRTSAFQDNKLNLCLGLLSNKDTLFLMDDGVYNVAHPKLLKRLDEIDVLVIEEHLIARGIEAEQPSIALATLKDLVTLSDQADKVITWQ
ncbi:sulfurtransferase complex subunit TusB [Thalassotalea ponticola]|uniref:sulfurtransferase complex subunit TusB n=1 Tax=Thalassotalea ponticola TaxID=1523392 RepID=UPI0025B61A51|nr:sulfurtransferase complex subunit TusB [Thalassotalea ponticola]MDN3651460.1 sulfurtransferase complex subunit TusB [Thalassotalea ponticola]